MDKNVNSKGDKVFSYGDMVQMFVDRASSQTKRRVEDPKKAICKIFSYIIMFNGLAEDTTILNNHPLTDWPILNEFKDFICPNSIRWKAGDKSFVDVLSRNFELENHSLTDSLKRNDIDYNDYLNALSEFRSFFKKDATNDFVSLASLRVDKSIADVSDFIVLSDGRCHYLGEPYLPILKVTLDDEMITSLVQNWYFNADIKEVYQSYLANLFF